MFSKLWDKISGHRQREPDQSYRSAAKELGISKSTIYDHDKRTSQRQKHPESVFWNTLEGQAFLKRLIVATIYTFGIKGGVGSGRIEEFMNQIRITTHAGVSESSIYRMMKEVELEIIRYKELEEQHLQEELKQQKEYLEVVLGADETWLDQMLLVCQELSSGYFFLKKPVKKEGLSNGIHPSNQA